MAKLIILYIFLSLFVASGWSTYKFEIDIIRKLNAEHANSTSFVISPFSIHQALAMLYLEKESRRDYQLAKGLGITGKGSEQIISHFDEAYHKLIKEQFILANHIFYPEKFNVTQHMKKMSDELHVDVAKLKFSNAVPFEYQKHDHHKEFVIKPPFVFVIKDHKHIYMAGRVDTMKPRRYFFN
nr:uncharacterized protein LOC108085534 isoform X2 [Drosophila kikkawai]